MVWKNNLPQSWGKIYSFHNGVITLTKAPPGEICLIVPEALALIMLTPQRGRETALGTDRKHKYDAPTGALEIIPPEAELFARWSDPKENILTSLNKKRLSDLAGMEFGREDFELTPLNAGLADQQVLDIANLLREELLRDSGPNDLVVDSLNVILWMHILRKHSSLANKEGNFHRGGISPKVWRKLDDFIREHISDKLTIEILAGMASLSPSHFLRSFRETTGLTPYQYILELRLQDASKLICSGRMPLNEIARTVGFSSQSHMTAVMTERWKITPAKLRSGES